MNALIYDNRGKDPNATWLNKLVESLKLFNISCTILEDDDLMKEYSADVVFVLGGDGTILFLSEFANKNDIPIIGINIGKLGFLAEFENNDLLNAVELFAHNKLIKDYRTSINVLCGEKCYFALNDAFVQRVYAKEIGCMVTEVKVVVDGIDVYGYKGDGVIISTPTGATAYSLSAGGSILAPNVEAFCVTPIAAHDFNQRPIVCSSSSEFKVEISGRAGVGLYADGKFIKNLEKGDCFLVKRANKPTVFLRKSNFNFFKRLQNKFKIQNGESYD